MTTDSQKQPNRLQGFSLIELLVVVVIITLLIAILLPALGRARESARRVLCASQQQQVALAIHFYLEDNNQHFFPRKELITIDSQDGTRWWFGFETYTSAAMAEGQRQLNRDLARLYPYHHAPESVEVCPSFRIKTLKYKPKYEGFWTTYGYNFNLIYDMGPARYNQISQPGISAMLTDTAQVNFWQQPATPSNPLVEEWDYFNRYSRSVHYRHDGLANLLFADGHVEQIKADATYDPKLPASMIAPIPQRISIELNP